MKLSYIESSDEVYHPMEPGKQDPSKIDGICFPVCYIKKLLSGRWEIKYYSEFYESNSSGLYSKNQTPNCKLILYPSGIKEIRFGV